MCVTHLSLNLRPRGADASLLYKNECFVRSIESQCSRAQCHLLAVQLIAAGYFEGSIWSDLIWIRYLFWRVRPLFDFESMTSSSNPSKASVWSPWSWFSEFVHSIIH